MDDDLFGTSQCLEYAGVGLRYWLAGSAQNPAVALTHGGWMDHRMFAPQMAALKQSYQVLTWDMRGHGLSQPWNGDIAYRRAADDLRRLLDEISAERAVLVGQSMGAAVVQEFAFRYPERVRGLVLIAGVDIMTRRSALSQLQLGAVLAISRLLPQASLRQNSERALQALSDRPEVQAYMREALARLPKATYLAIGRAVQQGFHAEPDYRLPAPFLLLCGERDRPAVHRAAAAWVSREPAGQYVVVPQAGHQANQDNPDFVNRHLLEFLDRL